MRARIRLVLLASVCIVQGAFVACGPIGGSPPYPTGSNSNSSSSSGGTSSSDAEVDAAPPTIVVNPETTYQTIDGFGGADTWQPGGPLTSEEGTLFFDPVNGIGLSLLRVGIDVNGTPLGENVNSDIQMAASYGARVWAAPWSPPAADKDNDDLDNGGHLCAAAGGSCAGDDYDAWATLLATFAANVYAQTNVPLYGVSAQNEPDFTAATYASCIYSPEEMVAFMDVLGSKLQALDPPVRLIAPEPDLWSHLWGSSGYGTAILADPAASTLVGVLATHDYGYGPASPPTGVTTPIWETEVSSLNGPPTVDIGNGILVAQWIYNAMVTGGASAWHYWWLVAQDGSDDESLIFQPGQNDAGGTVDDPPKRLYTVGNFSKFVRPGYQRIEVSGSAPAGVDVVAFQNPTDHTIAVVAINAGTTEATVPVTIAGTSAPSEFVPWVTSATENLAMHPAVAVGGGAFSATLPGQTVTTFVGRP